MASEILNKNKIIKKIELDSNIKAYLTNKETLIIEVIPKGRDHYLIINEELQKLKKKFNIHEIIKDFDKLYILIDNKKELLSKIKKLISVELNIEKQAICKGHGSPISKEEILNLFKMEKSICKILFETFKGEIGRGTGFFCELDNFPIKYALFTCNHVLNEIMIERGKSIDFECFEFQKSLFGSSYKTVNKKIKIEGDRKVFTNKELDYTCIELLKSDGIIDFFQIDPKLLKIDKTYLKDSDIFILQFPDGNSISFSVGKILSVKNSALFHNASTVSSSAGAPIIRRCKDNYIIGIHFGSIINKYNIATSFDSILNDIKEKYNKKNIKPGDINNSDQNENEINLFQNINKSKEEKEINKKEKIMQENDNENNKNKINAEMNNENNEESNLKKLKEELNDEKILNNKLKNEITELKNELKKVKNKNQENEEKIKTLQEELNKEKLKYKDLEEKMKFLEKPKEKKENSGNLYEIIFEKDNEISKLKNKIEKFPISLDEGEKLMSIIITSNEEDINYPIICKNTDKFYKIENEFYEAYSEYNETENIFSVKGKKIIKSKSLQENNILNHEIITISRSK